MNKWKIRDRIDSVINEIKVHWAVDLCENILKLHEIYEDERNIYLVLEY